MAEHPIYTTLTLLYSRSDYTAENPAACICILMKERKEAGNQDKNFKLCSAPSRVAFSVCTADTPDDLSPSW